MKRLISVFGLAVSLASASATDYTVRSFLTGTNVNLLSSVSGFTTNAYGDANVLYTNFPTTVTGNYTNYGFGVFSLTNTYYTPVNSPTNGATPVFSTNNSIGAFPGAFQDVNLWSYGNGEPTANAQIEVACTGTNASSTNVIVFTVTQLLAGSLVPSSAQNKFQFSLTMTGSGTVSLATNLPIVFTQGANALRLLNFYSSPVSNAPTVLVNFVRLRGWLPGPTAQ